jgi:hypothetical protein
VRVNQLDTRKPVAHFLESVKDIQRYTEMCPSFTGVCALDRVTKRGFFHADIILCLVIEIEIRIVC